MSGVEKNAGTLRKAHSDLSTQIFRTVLARVVLVVLIGLPFARAFESLNDQEIKSKREALETAAQKAGLTRSSYCGAEFMGEFCFKPGPTAEVAQMVDDLRGLYKQKFTIVTQVLGTSFSMDLRRWIFAMPFLLIASEMYLLVLRKKRALIAAVANRNLTDVSKGLPLDRLLFQGSSAAFARYPAVLVDYISLALILYTVAYVVSVSSEFWQNTETLTLLLQTLFTATLYMIALYCYIASRMETQVKELLAIHPRKNGIVKAWQKVGALAHRIIFCLKPKKYLTVGSGLTLLSLVMLFGIDSCEGKTARGYQIVSGQIAVGHPASWIGTFLDDWVRVVYVIALVIAALTLCILLPGLSRVLENRVVVIQFYRLSGAICLYILSVLCTGWLQWVILSPIYLGLTLLLWWVFRSSRWPSVAKKWPGLRSFLLILYLPLVIAVGQYFWESRLAGWPVLLAGITAITIGYMRQVIKSESTVAVEQTAPVEIAKPGY